MESHIHEWLNLLIRWIHFIVGVAWIGASFYFNWLENRLNRQLPQEEGIAGNLWAVHGGGFYHLKKYKVGPDQIPAQLHWFKWEAYTTWLSGMTLLIVVYYFNARFLLIDPEVRLISESKAIVIGIISVIGSWFLYDAACRSALRSFPKLLSLSIFLYLALLAWFLSDVFSGRAAYIHVGAAIGSMMVGNVFFVIIPAQKEMVAALAGNRDIDPEFGKRGLQRSIHNNYLTLPVLFLMISNHFPSTYGHQWNWLILICLAVVSVAVRHYFNIRHLRKSMWITLPMAFVALTAIMWFSAPKQIQVDDVNVSDQQILEVVQQRCASCHSSSPTQPGFAAPPAGLRLENLEQININLERVYQATVITRVMPIGNLTQMSDAERILLSQWYAMKTSSSSAVAE